MDSSNEFYMKLRYKLPGGRICSVFGCHNSGKKLSDWLKVVCGDVHKYCTRDFYK